MELISSTAALSISRAASARIRVFRFLTVAVVAVAVSSQLLPLFMADSCPDQYYSRYSPLRIFLQKQPMRPVRVQCVMFNFGDSNTDTGGLVAAAGFRLKRPVGRRFFGKPSGRFCDGRLYIDFICGRLGLDHLSPYLESSGVTFRHGANFAVAGATAAAQSKSFSLPTQVRQFRHFKARTAELLPLGLGSGITDEEFQNAIYSFDIGQNDISLAFSANLTYERILEEAIPATITRIRNAVTMVYEAGGRKFLMYNTGPSGCMPRTLARRKRRDIELDRAGCLVRHNNADKAFNAQLSRLRHQLTAELPNATVVCVDLYAIKYGLIVNHTAHGFSNPLMPCCDGGGPPYNFEANKKKASGRAKAKACSESDVSKYISWDGTHYTEAANKIVADKILSSEYSEPQLHLQTLCSA